VVAVGEPDAADAPGEATLALADTICDGRNVTWGGPDLTRDEVAVLITKHTTEAVAAATRELREAADDLTTIVNHCRYRGVRGHDPMTDKYRWPLPIMTHEAIAEAALEFVVALEKAARKAAP